MPAPTISATRMAVRREETLIGVRVASEVHPGECPRQVRGGETAHAQPEHGAALDPERGGVDTEQHEGHRAGRADTRRLPAGGEAAEPEELGCGRERHRPWPQAVVAGASREVGAADDIAGERDAGVQREDPVAASGRDTEQDHVGRHDAREHTAEPREADRVGHPGDEDQRDDEHAAHRLGLDAKLRREHRPRGARRRRGGLRAHGCRRFRCRRFRCRRFRCRRRAPWPPGRRGTTR